MGSQAPLPNITTLQTDITLPSTIPLVLDALGGRKADLVVCDGAPDGKLLSFLLFCQPLLTQAYFRRHAVTGVHDLDAYLHSQLLLAALTLSLTLMAPGATLIFKIFLSPLDPRAEFLASQLKCFFSSPLPEDKEKEDEFGQYAEFEEEGEYAEEAGQDKGDEKKRNVGTKGYDPQGRRGGVWVRKPRSSRQGSAGTSTSSRSFFFLSFFSLLPDVRTQRLSSSAATFHLPPSPSRRHSPPRLLTNSGPPQEPSLSIPSPLSSPKTKAKVKRFRVSKEVKSK